MSSPLPSPKKNNNKNLMTKDKNKESKLCQSGSHVKKKIWVSPYLQIEINERKTCLVTSEWIKFTLKSSFPFSNSKHWQLDLFFFLIWTENCMYEELYWDKMTQRMVSWERERERERDRERERQRDRQRGESFESNSQHEN